MNVSMKQSDIPEEIQGAENVLAMRLCKRHGKPMRKGQRNCHQCNVEANKKYRTGLRRAQKQIADLVLKHFVGPGGK